MFSTCLLWYKGLQVLQGNRPEVQLSLSVVSINERQHSLKKVTLAEAQSKTPLEQALRLIAALQPHSCGDAERQSNVL